LAGPAYVYGQITLKFVHGLPVDLVTPRLGQRY